MLDPDAVLNSLTPRDREFISKLEALCKEYDVWIAGSDGVYCQFAFREEEKVIENACIVKGEMHINRFG